MYYGEFGAHCGPRVYLGPGGQAEFYPLSVLSWFGFKLQENRFNVFIADRTVDMVGKDGIESMDMPEDPRERSLWLQ